MRSEYQGTGGPKVRILVVGDSGTGKTSLVRRLCCSTEEFFESEITRLTVGCAVDVMSYSHKSGNRFFIEFFDVGGSSRYELSRSLFYTQINGILLTFDSSNSVSYNNLKKWIKELVEVNHVHPLEESYHKSNSHNITVEELDLKLGELPLLCIGTKYNEAHAARDSNRAQQVLKQYGVNCVFVVRSPRTVHRLTTLQDSLSEVFDPSSLHGFFDDVIQRRHFTNGVKQSETSTARILGINAKQLSSRTTDPSPYHPSRFQAEDV